MLSFDHERCDRCGARAKHLARRAGIYTLTFCTHHYNQHRDALVEQYWTIESDVTEQYVTIPAKTN